MKQNAPAAERNKQVILDVLRSVLPPEGLVLEVASGSGQHAVHFAPALAPRRWLPTDIEESQLHSISAWQQENSIENLFEPQYLDVTDPDWPDTLATDNYPVTAIVNINMIHISPWFAAEGLFEGAGALLAKGGVLYLYGPFFHEDIEPAPSNQEFDEWLRDRNPAWGVRDLEEVEVLAEANGFELADKISMPANNLSLVFRRT